MAMGLFQYGDLLSRLLWLDEDLGSVREDVVNVVVDALRTALHGFEGVANRALGLSFVEGPRFFGVVERFAVVASIDRPEPHVVIRREVEIEVLPFKLSSAADETTAGTADVVGVGLIEGDERADVDVDLGGDALGVVEGDGDVIFGVAFEWAATYL